MPTKKNKLFFILQIFINGTKNATIETAAICREMFIPITKILHKKKNNTKYLISILYL